MHRSRRIAAVLVSIGLATLAFTLPASAGGRPFTTSLSGAAERPTAGDPDATGTARVTVNPGTREVCWSVSVDNVDLPVIAAHIHIGGADTFGPPVIFLLPEGVSDADGEFSGCSTIDRSLAFALLLSPEDYYVNVHTDLFQAGAARGQL
ncbi:MAG TPA: CHRD domain-containing protein [Actinomycetota bacterium]